MGIYLPSRGNNVRNDSNSPPFSRGATPLTPYPLVQACMRGVRTGMEAWARIYRVKDASTEL